GVDLDDVDRPCAVPGERDAALAGAAGGVRRALLAVEAPGEDPGARRLAAPSWAREEIGVVDAPGTQRLHERLGDVLLTDDVGEGLGPVAAVQGGAHRTDPNRRDRHGERLDPQGRAREPGEL